MGALLQRSGSDCVSAHTAGRDCRLRSRRAPSAVSTAADLRRVGLCVWFSFVVDASDPKLFPLAQKEMQSLLAQPTLTGVPLLVLLNKNDLPTAISPEEVVKELSGTHDTCDCTIDRAGVAHLCSTRMLMLCCCAVLRVCLNHRYSQLESLVNRDVSYYSVSCKNIINIDKTLEWIVKRANQNKNKK